MEPEVDHPVLPATMDGPVRAARVTGRTRGATARGRPRGDVLVCELLETEAAGSIRSCGPAGARRDVVRIAHIVHITGMAS